MGEDNIETSKALQDLFYRYTHLSIGGKEVACPYWMNNLKKGIFGPYGGKGMPEQIVEVVKNEAQQERCDLSKMSKEEILSFMKEKRIGIDCSGFVFWMLDTFDHEKGGNGIADDIPNCQGKVLECRANVEMLTDEKLTISVGSLKEVRVGDMIRLGGGKHVAVVMVVTREEELVKTIDYAHSSATTLVKGVHLGEIKIVDPSLSLEKQEWEEKMASGESYARYFFPGLGDGIKRLKIWA